MTLDLATDFLAMTPKAQSIKEQVDKLDFIKIKTSAFRKTLLEY